MPIPVAAPVAPAIVEVEALEYDESGTFIDNGTPWTGNRANLESAMAHYAEFDAAQKVLAI